MTRKLAVCLLAAALSVAVFGAAAQQQQRAKASDRAPASSKQDDPPMMRIEGEKRFRANCGRCHMAPHKFPPRMMATIVRHMRVRATLTDRDVKLILRYMTE
ncbi:MAG TPA: cytochrome c [Candidatus Acidoferrales bacterium]|nr:cytochrome c [Candidatus Acidoferrales bacterium]